MKLKHSTRIAGVQPEVVLAMIVVSSVYEQLGHELTITSVCDGTHSRKSLHYVGHAFDCRTSSLPADIAAELPSRLKAALGVDFDVVEHTTHLHVEFQPKSNR